MYNNMQFMANPTFKYKPHYISCKRVMIFFVLCVALCLWVKEAHADSITNPRERFSPTQKGIEIFPKVTLGGASSAGAQPPREYGYQAAGQPKAKDRRENLSLQQKQARMYRQQGLEFQRIGNLEAAMSLFQKAIELDPGYAVAYNDLGILYEANGFYDRAEDSYLRALKIDPDYLSAYTNLALFYENKRDLKKAEYYWQKRVELGLPDDPWTQKAEQRLEDMRLVLGEKPIESKEQDIIELTKDVAAKKAIIRYDDKALAVILFERARESYKNGNLPHALKQAVDAQLLDPSNKTINDFVDKLQTRLLSR
jgi:tetratricopeptide (TPR) repeat protein